MRKEGKSKIKINKLNKMKNILKNNERKNIEKKVGKTKKLKKKKWNIKKK